MDIDTMPGGREMDALVAEKIMGWSGIVCYAAEDDYSGIPPGCVVSQGIFWRPPVLYYSTDIAAAWEVVEKLHSLGYWVRIRSAMDAKLQTRGWAVCIGKFWNREGFGDWAEIAPTAVCRAALKAVLDNQA